MEPTDAFSRAALVGVRWRKGNPYQDRRALRVSQRLAAGMSVAEVARAERADTAAIESLLAQDGFAAVVESWRAMAEQPEAEQTARLVRLARLAIENALTDWDMGAAFFVLRENAQGRDPAHTIAERIIATAKRTAAPVAPMPPAETRLRRPPRRRHRVPTTRSTPWSTARPPPCAAPSSPSRPSAPRRPPPWPRTPPLPPWLRPGRRWPRSPIPPAARLAARPA